VPDVTSRLTAALADRYRIERELGQGGMATVYLAEGLKHDREVALKVLTAYHRAHDIPRDDRRVVQSSRAAPSPAARPVAQAHRKL
jgi:hypothetical protein